jgi:plasmid stability protein
MLLRSRQELRCRLVAKPHRHGHSFSVDEARSWLLHACTGQHAPFPCCVATQSGRASGAQTHRCRSSAPAPAMVVDAGVCSSSGVSSCNQWRARRKPLVGSHAVLPCSKPSARCAMCHRPQYLLSCGRVEHWNSVAHSSHARSACRHASVLEKLDPTPDP